LIFESFKSYSSRDTVPLKINLFLGKKMSFLISVEVFDADRAGKDKSLGKVDIPAADLAASAQGRWFPLKGTLQTSVPDP
jgi:hypothetical protein